MEKFETSRHLDDEPQIFVFHFTGFAQWHPSNSDTTLIRMMINDGPKHLAVVAVGFSRTLYGVAN